MDIMLTVSYSVEISKDEFFCPEMSCDVLPAASGYICRKKNICRSALNPVRW